MDTLTRSDQLLLIEIARNNCQIKTKDQKTFNCKFYESISKLVRLGFVRSYANKRDRRLKTYILSDVGKLVSMALCGNEKKKDYMVFFLSSNLFEIDFTKENPLTPLDCKPPQKQQSQSQSQ